MTRRTAAPRQQSTQQRAGRLDAVVPTAIAALDAKRVAYATLRLIDDLLQEDGPVLTSTKPISSLPVRSSTKPRPFDSESTPGPGAYDPQKERTQWRRQANVTWHHPTPASDKKTAIVRREHARAVVQTPGPGAYSAARADRVVKPRVRMAEIRLTKPVSREQAPPPPVSQPVDLTTADKWLSRYVPPKGAVVYKSSSAKDGLPRDQRDRLRRIHLDKTRHTRLGFYSVRFGLVERRVGSVGIVSMGKTSVRDSARQRDARSRRQLRAWQSADATPQRLKPPPTEPKTETRKRPTATIQWQRARARALLHQCNAAQRLRSATDKRPRGDIGLATRSLRRDLRAHDMAKHVGRDTVHCPRKHLKITTPFSSTPRKERSRPPTTSPPPPTGVASAGVAYATMLGRGEFDVDANGVHLLGRDYDGNAERRRLVNTDPKDDVIRPRAPAVVMRAPSPPRQPPVKDELVLSPQYTLVEKRTRGHAFLKFENKLDRDERARPKAFACDRGAESLDVSVTAKRTHETLQFPRRDRGIITFQRMRSRDETVKPLVDIMEDASAFPSRHPRDVCRVDMTRCS